jgi:SAM-dependent methyltransferase
MNSPTRPRVLPAALQYWRDLAGYKGALDATRQLVADLWEFLRDSSPSRLRLRFGDADYDWQYRVNTTSGAVGWRDRLLGVFHSAYQPTEPEAFHEMLQTLPAHLNLHDFTFIDLGSGKGRALLMASDYPFRLIVGVELLPALQHIARQNLAQYQSPSQKCFALESVCADATNYTFHNTPLLIYLFNPFPEAVLRRVLQNLSESLRSHPRPACLLYYNPVLEHLLTEAAAWEKITGTHQYSMFRFRCIQQ